MVAARLSSMLGEWARGDIAVILPASLITLAYELSYEATSSVQQ